MRYAFGPFTLDTERVELTRGEQFVPLEPKIYDLLVFLITNRDRVVSKDDIFDNVWPGVFVSEASISGAVKQLRQALGDDGQAQRYLRTARGKGFRFVAHTTVERAASQVEQPETAVPLEEATTPTDGPPSIAVVRFALIQSEEAHSAIADGIPIELIATLSRSRAVRVIARGSSFRFGSDTLDLDAIRGRLGASYVLSGSVELMGKRLTLVAELTDTRSHRVIWSDSYTGSLDDVFAIRQTIARDVSTAIELRVPLNEADALANTPTENLDAWGHYHIGIRHLFRFNGADNDKARHHMERAIALDPHFARAYGGLSYAELEAYNLFFGSDRQKTWSLGLSMAEKAADLDPFDPFCNLTLGRAKWMAGQLDEAIGWADRSVGLNPNYAFGHYNLGKLKAISCAGKEADEFAASSILLSPLDPHMQSMLSARAVAGFVRDDEESALKYAAQSLQAPNPHLYVRVLAAAIFTSYGRAENAHHALETVADSYQGFTKAHFQSLFTLRDEQRNKKLFDALTSLGL